MGCTASLNYITCQFFLIFCLQDFLGFICMAVSSLGWFEGIQCRVWLHLRCILRIKRNTKFTRNPRSNSCVNIGYSFSFMSPLKCFFLVQKTSDDSFVKLQNICEIQGKHEQHPQISFLSPPVYIISVYCASIFHFWYDFEKYYIGYMNTKYTNTIATYKDHKFTINMKGTLKRTVQYSTILEDACECLTLLIEIMDKGFRLCPINDNTSSKGGVFWNLRLLKPPVCYMSPQRIVPPCRNYWCRSTNKNYIRPVLVVEGALAI